MIGNKLMQIKSIYETKFDKHKNQQSNGIWERTDNET